MMPSQRVARMHVKFGLYVVFSLSLTMTGTVTVHGQAAASGASAKEEAAAQYAEAGQRALSAGQYASAQENFEKLAKLEPTIAEVHATLAVIYFKQRAYEDAVREIHTAQKLKPSLPKLDSLMGVSLAELGRFKESLPGLEKGFKQATDVEIRRMCGMQLLRVYTGLDRNSDAVETALALNKFYPDDPEVLYNTSRIYGNYTYLMMEKLRDKAPDSVWMLQAAGEAHESEKDYDAALQSFDHVLKLEPGRPGVHYKMGRVYLRRFQDSHDAKDQGFAADQFRAELEIDPLNGNALYELAQLDHDSGRLQDSRKEFETLVTARPDFEQARVGLAAVLVESDATKLAVAQLQRAVELDPEDEVAWYRLSQTLRMTGDVEGQKKAMATFRKVHATVVSRQVRAGERLPDGAVTPQQLDKTAEQEATQP